MFTSARNLSYKLEFLDRLKGHSSTVICNLSETALGDYLYFHENALGKSLYSDAASCRE